MILEKIMRLETDHPVYPRLPERQFRTIRYATGRRKNNSLQGKQDNRVFRSWFKELELIIARYCGPRWPSTICAVDGLRDMPLARFTQNDVNGNLRQYFLQW